MQSERLYSPGTRTARGWLWLVVPCALLGLLTCAELFTVATRFRSGGLVAIVGALVGLPLLFIAVMAFRQGIAYARAYIPTICWWHVLWALTVVSALVFRVRDVSVINSDPVDAWALFRIAVDAIVAFALLLRLTLRRTHWLGSMFQGLVGVLTVYCLVCLASTGWSVFPAWTIFKSWEYMVDVAVLAAVLVTVDSVEGFRNFWNWTWALQALLLLSVWKDVILWPKLALHSGEILKGAVLGIRLQGVMPEASSNDVATFSSILAVVCLARLFPATNQERYSKSWYAALLMFSLVSLVLSQTRAAIVGLLLAGFIILLHSERGRLGALVTLVVTPVVALFTMGGVLWSFFARGQNAEQMDTLSSRTEWWGLAWHAFLQRPLTGFGAYAAARFAVLGNAGFGGTGTLHNDYMEVLAGTGVWGLIPLLAALGATWWFLWRDFRKESDPQARQLIHEAVALLALLTIRSVFNNMMTIHPALPFLIIVGYAEFLRRRKAMAQDELVYHDGQVDSDYDPAAEPLPD